MSGAFQTSRDIFASPIWKNVVDFRMFFLIYGNAVFAEEGVRLADDLILQRGEWCRSTRKLQEDLEYIENRQIKTYSTSVINRCIKRLEALQMICTRTHQLGTVFRVVNYDKYQGLDNYRKSNLERNLEHSGNSGGTLGEHSGNNNKNVNNAKKDNKVEKELKKEYADYVFLTESEYDKLTQLLGPDERDSYFLRFASWISGQTKRVQQQRSAYLSILNWHKEDQKKVKPFKPVQGSSYQNTKARLQQMLDEEEEKKRGESRYYQTGTDTFS